MRTCAASSSASCLACCLLSPSAGISSAGPVSTYMRLLWPKRIVSPTLLAASREAGRQWQRDTGNAAWRGQRQRSDRVSSNTRSMAECLHAIRRVQGGPARIRLRLLCCCLPRAPEWRERARAQPVAVEERAVRAAAVAQERRRRAGLELQHRVQPRRRRMLQQHVCRGAAPKREERLPGQSTRLQQGATLEHLQAKVSTARGVMGCTMCQRRQSCSHACKRRCIWPACHAHKAAISSCRAAADCCSACLRLTIPGGPTTVAAHMCLAQTAAAARAAPAAAAPAPAPAARRRLLAAARSQLTPPPHPALAAPPALPARWRGRAGQESRTLLPLLRPRPRATWRLRCGGRRSGGGVSVCAV